MVTYFMLTMPTRTYSNFFDAFAAGHFPHSDFYRFRHVASIHMLPHDFRQIGRFLAADTMSR